MRHDRKVIEMALAPLVGLPLWSAGRAADLEWFQFGARHVVVARVGKAKGSERTVGEFALHVQCAWRIVGPNGVVVASRNRYVPADDPDSVSPEWEWEQAGANRCDERIHAWCHGNAYVVRSVAADTLGGLSLVLSDDFTLDVFPDDSVQGEHWRLLRYCSRVARRRISWSAVAGSTPNSVTRLAGMNDGIRATVFPRIADAQAGKCRRVIDGSSTRSCVGSRRGSEWSRVTSTTQGARR
jgi:hypothetical protein